MNTHTLEINKKETAQRKTLPNTARGRAIYTTEWFLTGVTGSRQYDNPNITLSNAVYF